MENYQIVDRNLAPKGLRFANYLIDFIFYLVSMFLVGVSIVLTGMEDLLDVLENPLLERVFGMISYFLFMFLQEISMGGRSLGKFITGTKVVTDYGDKPTTHTLFIRNISRIVPFEAFSFLGTLGWHDKWSETRVVKSQPFDFDFENNYSLDDIGNNTEETPNKL